MGTVKPGGDRVAKWDLKYDPDRIKAITEAGKPTYLAHATTAFNSLHDMEVAVKQVLNGEGVSVADVSDYLCFGREMWKKTRKYSGETVALEASTLVAKWVARRLSQSVLEKIRYDVFSVAAPVGP
jgi:hypothetical protein